MTNFPFFKKQIEMQSIKKAANITGAACSCMLVLNITLQVVLLVWLKVLGFTDEALKELLKNNAILMLLQAGLSALVFTLPFIIPVKMGNVRVCELLPMEKVKKGTLLPSLMIGMGCCQLAEAFSMLFYNALAVFGINPSYDMGFSYEEGILPFLVSVLTVAVLPALLEEFAMRGVVMGLMRPFGDGFAILVSAFIFGLIHGNLVQIPFAFLVGLGLGFITVKSGSLWPAVAVHFTNNFMAVITEYLSSAVDTRLFLLIRISVSVLWLVLGIFGVLMLSLRDKTAFNLKKSETEARFGEKIKWTVTAPFFVIALVMLAVKLITA